MAVVVATAKRIIKLRLDDFRIHSKDKLDRILARCCELVFEKHAEDPEYWGMVGACVLGTGGKIAYGVNHIADGSLRDHAEVAAVKNYVQKYGGAGSLNGAIVVTTLSPCSTDIDQPGGINCTEYLEGHGIKKVYCGWSDPGQVDTEVFRHKRFHIQETRNGKLQELCRRMAETFLNK